MIYVPSPLRKRSMDLTLAEEISDHRRLDSDYGSWQAPRLCRGDRLPFRDHVLRGGARAPRAGSVGLRFSISQPSHLSCTGPRDDRVAEARQETGALRAAPTCSDQPRVRLDLTQQRPEFLPAPPVLRKKGSSLTRVDAMLPPRPPAPLEALSCSRSGALPPMQPTAPPLPHCWTPTAVPRRVLAPQRGAFDGSPRGLPFLSGPDSRFIGSILGFCQLPPAPRPPVHTARDDRLTAGTDVDVLDEHTLPTLGLELEECQTASLIGVHHPR